MIGRQESRAYRLALGIPFEKAVAISGVSHTTLLRWEKDKYEVPVRRSVLRRIDAFYSTLRDTAEARA